MAATGGQLKGVINPARMIRHNGQIRHRFTAWSTSTRELDRLFMITRPWFMEYDVVVIAALQRAHMDTPAETA